MIPERKKYIEYLEPHDTDYVCFMVAKPKPLPKWQDLARPLEVKVWIWTLASVTVSLSFLVTYAAVTSDAEFSASGAVLYIVSVLLSESHSTTYKIR